MGAHSAEDDLYRGPLDQFTAARNALARTLAGDDAKRVKRLQKPTVPAWAANQVYWHARPVLDRLTEAGRKLRRAQLAALKGRSDDVRRAKDLHQKAVGEAVDEAVRRAEQAGLRPSREELTRTFEAMSLASEPVEPLGRLTRALRPAGFEALAGVRVTAPKSSARAPAVAAEPSATAVRAGASGPAGPKRIGADESAAATRRADVQRIKQRERAGRLVERRRAAEQKARSAWERARRDLAAAELKLAALRD
jgi:hypothetical protein